MRPTDENQPTSTRPNLISSSRPAGGEDNILAMLERDSARGLGGRISGGPHRLWYVGGAGVAAVLVGALVWLAYENNTARQARLLAEGKPEAAQTQAAATAAPAVAAAPAAPRAAPAQPGTALGPQEEIIAPAQAAVIVDNPEPPAPRQAEASASEPPPLVLLTPQEAAGTRPPHAVREAPPVPDTVRATPPVTQVREQPPVRAPTQARTAPALVAAAKPAATARPAAPAKSAAKPLTAAARRTKKAQAAAPHAEVPVDNDVALISAIISHASSHAAERAQAEAAACSGPSPDKKCAAKPTPQR